MERVAVLLAGAVFGAAPALDAQTTAATDNGNQPAVATAVRAAEGVRIDGADEDAVWQSAPLVDDFRQFEPELDAEPTHRTAFRVAYDEDNLYLFVRAFDPHPDSIMHALSRRDVREPSDQIGVFVDSYGDRRSGFNFYVNPDGVKRDFAIYDDAMQDGSWNGVWDVATRVDSLGWTAEFRIPLSQLRYVDAPRHSFGFGVRREIERYNERVSWPHHSRTTAGLISQLGRLDGLEGLGSSRRVELTPYAVTKSVSRADAQGGFERAQLMSAGGDLKVGLTPNITLDATVNPDFGQVEADPAVLNLTAFETFLSERRPFFLEGTGLYGFALNCYIVVDCSTNEGLFYSRRIGRSPALLDDYGDATTATSTPIAAALKLTGRGAGGLSFGALDAVTRHVGGTNGSTVEPRTNYAVLRAEQDLHGGEAGIGWIATAVNRSLDQWTAPRLHESAYVTGVTFRSRFGGRNYEIAGSLAGSRVAGSPEAVTRTQRSAVHYYQQPGDALQVDSARSSLSGYAAQLKIGKYAGGITRFETTLVRQSGGFEANDLGYLRRADVQDWSTWAALSLQSPTRLYRWAQANANTWHHWNTSGLHLESAVNLNAHMGLHNNWNIHAGGTMGRLGGSHCDRCTRGGPPLRQSRGIFPWFGVNSDSRRTVAAGIWVNLSYSDEGQSRSTSLSPYVDLRVSTSLRANLGVNIYRADNHTQWLDNFTDVGGDTHYAFAHLDQRTVSMNLRLSYAPTPDLTLEVYAEPFTTSGAYSNVREVSATPHAEAYADRFQAYVPPAGTATMFSFRQLRTNSVLRWEYRPGSTVFLVWAHGRQASDDDRPRVSWQNDFRNLFNQRPDNTFLIKVAYWLNR